MDPVRRLGNIVFKPVVLRSRGGIRRCSEATRQVHPAAMRLSGRRPFHRGRRHLRRGQAARKGHLARARAERGGVFYSLFATGGGELTALSLDRPAAPSRAGQDPWGPRLRVRLRQRILDREIAVGLSPDADRDRALRARQLTSMAERGRVAACLAIILEAADERHADPASPLKLNHAQVLAARHEIVALIDVLRGEQAVCARGVALARMLVQDNRSLLLIARAGRTVQQAVHEALAALQA